MKNAKWWILFILAIAIYVLFWSHKKIESNNSVSSKVSKLTEIIQNIIYYDASNIPDVDLSTIDGEQIRLSEAFNDLCIVIYLPTLGCSSCYEKELDLLCKTIPNDLKCKMLVVGKFSNVRELKLFEKKCKMRTLKLEDSVKSFPISFFEENPVAFILNKELLGFAFFDMVNHVDYSELYYNVVVNRMQLSFKEE